MDALGVLGITAGIWLVYSGVTGIDPLKVITAIIASPANASAIVRDAKAAVSPVTVGSSGTGTVTGDASTYGSWGISRGFAQHKKDGSGSPGIDFKVPVGTPIPSPVSGLVTFSGPNAGGYGNLVTVTTKDGYRWNFGHVSKFAGKSNREITAGTVIAYSGGVKGASGSGNSTGPHVHIDVRNPQGVLIDPASRLGIK